MTSGGVPSVAEVAAAESVLGSVVGAPHWGRVPLVVGGPLSAAAVPVRHLQDPLRAHFVTVQMVRVCGRGGGAKGCTGGRGRG
jgi:hypothetical protein